ncbi:MAG: LolA family protein [Deltaproteobacteria bacterium]
MPTALALAILFVATPAPAPEERAIASMQALYERAKDLSAHFEQHYESPALHKKLESSGTLRWKRPGMLRFEYEAPEKKTFVVAGERFTSYVPDAAQAMEGSFHASELSASVAFLFGKGRLEREFRLSAPDRKDLAPGVQLELTPKKPDPRLSRVYFVLDPKSFAVRESLVVDGAGDENRFDFTDIQTNTGLSAAAFELKLPPGTDVVKSGE